MLFLQMNGLGHKKASPGGRLEIIA